MRPRAACGDRIFRRREMDATAKEFKIISCVSVCGVGLCHFNRKRGLSSFSFLFRVQRGNLAWSQRWRVGEIRK